MTAVTGDPKRYLLILPRGFYGFAKVLASALQRRGYEVTTANDEYPESAHRRSQLIQWAIIQK